ncbi:tetratricopeptide repeat protein [uncultured Eudoraea sp.]|uniref:tetratricopeptide repeat protein n=1 Tax=uncultured Eudoraea sp. TaxID=1035614 RepID=UPI002612F54C|nr:tetratricopeptide repeat protein [uncultured Eudoraea sp.]
MRLVLKITKIILATVFTVYSLILAYQLFLTPKEKRFHLAGNMQGLGLSQAMFDILNWQHPNYSDPYFERSVAFNKRGDYATGFYYLDKAVELEPNKHLGYRGYMKLRFLRDFKGALIDFNRLDSLTPNVKDAPWGEDIDFLRGESYFGLKDYTRALEYFQQSLSNQGTDWADVQTFIYQGLCHYELADYNGAISSFESALIQYDKTCEADFGLGRTYLQLGDTLKGIDYLRKAKENIAYKRDDTYKEYLNEIYQEEIEDLLANLKK